MISQISQRSFYDQFCSAILIQTVTFCEEKATICNFLYGKSKEIGYKKRVYCDIPLALYRISCPPIWCYPYVYSRFDQEVAGSQSVLKTDYSLLYQHQAAMLPASQNIAKSQPKKLWHPRGGQIFTNSCIKKHKKTVIHPIHV